MSALRSTLKAHEANSNLQKWLGNKRESSNTAAQDMLQKRELYAKADAWLSEKKENVYPTTSNTTATATATAIATATATATGVKETKATTRARLRLDEKVTTVYPPKTPYSLTRFCTGEQMADVTRKR